MAIKPADEYVYTTPASAAYPGGSFLNASAPGAEDGTPFEQKWPNDIYGFLQGLLATAGIVPSGTPDTALVSQYRDAMESLMWSPGDYKWCAYSTPERRWLECNGDSIGSAASGGTARANADTFALFSKLWAEPAYVIQTSVGGASARGASAAADFAANKRMVLPDWRGGTLRAWDHGRGVDVDRALGTEQTDAMQNITGSFTVDDLMMTGVAGAFYDAGSINYDADSRGGGGHLLGFDASRQVRTALETRMRNGSAMLVIRF